MRAQAKLAVRQAPRYRVPWMLAGILLLAAAVRTPGLFAGLWHDEIMYSRVYFDDPAKRAWLLWSDVHPPLYPLLLWLWSSIFGNHEAVLRLPSFLSGLVSILAVWKLAHQVFSRRVAVLAALLLSLSPPHIWYSVENKANMLALCLSALAIWLFVRANEASSWRKVLLATTVLAAALATHSYAVTIGATLLVWLAWRGWKESGARRSLAAVAALAVVWALLFFWKIHAQGASLGRPYLRALDAGELYKLLFVWLPHGNTIRNTSPYDPFSKLVSQPWGYWIVDAIGAVVLLLGLVAALRGACSRDDSRWTHRLILLWFVPPLIAAAAISLVVPHFYIERNFIILLPGFVLLLAVGADHLRSRALRWPAGASIVLLAAWGTVALLTFRREQWTVYKPKPDWRAAASWLRSEAYQEGRLAVVVTAPSLEADFYLARTSTAAPEIKVVDYCSRPVSPVDFARLAGGSSWLVENQTWPGCWKEAWQRAADAPGVGFGREVGFSNIVIHEVLARKL